MVRRRGYEKLKPGKTKQERFDRHNIPKDRKFGQGEVRCRRCGSSRGHINKYGLDVCRRCFREIASKIGFKKRN